MRSWPTRRFAGWIQIGIGIGVVLWWGVVAITDGIDELDEGRIDILFHVTAELVMAILLVTAGTLILTGKASSLIDVVSGMALGALLYSSINSPGYFAGRGEWWLVAMFAVAALASIGAAVGLIRNNHALEPAIPKASVVGAGMEYGPEP